MDAGMYHYGLDRFIYNELKRGVSFRCPRQKR